MGTKMWVAGLARRSQQLGWLVRPVLTPSNSSCHSPKRLDLGHDSPRALASTSNTTHNPHPTEAKFKKKKNEHCMNKDVAPLPHPSRVVDSTDSPSMI